MNRGNGTPAFPSVSGSNLNGKRFRLPNDFESDLNIAIVAFKRKHVDLIESWQSSITQMAEKNARLGFYELPVLSAAYSPFRWWIDGGMRAGILSGEVRKRTINRLHR